MLMVPVGATVVTVAFRRGGSPISAYRLSAKAGKEPRSAAICSDLSRASHVMNLDTTSDRSSAFSDANATPSRMNRSANPMKPSPILRVLRTIWPISGRGYSLTSMIESRKSTAP